MVEVGDEKKVRPPVVVARFCDQTGKLLYEERARAEEGPDEHEADHAEDRWGKSGKREEKCYFKISNTFRFTIPHPPQQNVAEEINGILLVDGQNGVDGEGPAGKG